MQLASNTSSYWLIFAFTVKVEFQGFFSLAFMLLPKMAVLLCIISTASWAVTEILVNMPGDFSPGLQCTQHHSVLKSVLYGNCVRLLIAQSPISLFYSYIVLNATFSEMAVKPMSFNSILFNKLSSINKAYNVCSRTQLEPDFTSP